MWLNSEINIWCPYISVDIGGNIIEIIWKLTEALILLIDPVFTHYWCFIRNITRVCIFVSAVGEESRNWSSSTVSSLVNVRNLGLKQQITTGTEDGGWLIPGIEERGQGEAKDLTLSGGPCHSHSLWAAFSSLSNPDSAGATVSSFPYNSSSWSAIHIFHKNNLWDMFGMV